MEDFIRTQLHPVDACIICTEPFSATHHPVALPCKHIFGHQCIKRWLSNGRGNHSACPTCRYVVLDNRNTGSTLDAASIWKAVCEQPPERLHSLMTKIWSGLQVLWQGDSSGNFTISAILDHAVIPALMQTALGTEHPADHIHDPVLDCYNLVAASWGSLGRPDNATGLAIPLVRLARLMSSASATLPKWLTTNPRANRLLWRANACLDMTNADMSWDMVMEAARLDPRLFPLLHAYTVLLSQSIAHLSQPKLWPTRRHEVVSLVIGRCCTRIAGVTWKGQASEKFKNTLVVVYEELWRYQLEKGKMSLRGREGEEDVVKGIWALANWTTGKS